MAICDHPQIAVACQIVRSTNIAQTAPRPAMQVPDFFGSNFKAALKPDQCLPTKTRPMLLEVRQPSGLRDRPCQRMNPGVNLEPENLAMHRRNRRAALSEGAAIPRAAKRT